MARVSVAGRRVFVWVGLLALVGGAWAEDGPIERREPTAETSQFQFFSHFDFNLYDALETASTARLRERPGAENAVLGETCRAELPTEHRAAWDAAVAYFVDAVASTSDFSQERYVLRSHLANLPAEHDADDDRFLTSGLLFLRAAAPAYRACRWPEQEQLNQRWIQAVVERLDRDGEVLQQRLEALFGQSWRTWPIPVDVVETVGWSGANTVGFPQTHIQISSKNSGYQGAAALEMVFHEASHELVTPRYGTVARGLAQAADAAGVEIPHSLWHGLMFLTVGEVTRAHLEAQGEAGYEPYAYAQGVFDGRWKPMLEPLEATWLPYVRDELPRERAFEQLIAACAEAGC